MSFTGVGAHPALGLASQKLVKSDPELTAQERAPEVSPRQRELNRRWAYYKCEQYAARSVAWDGSRVVGRTEHDTIALAGYVPPGFYVANSETLPIQFRRPSTPYHLCRVIVDRFTGLLFGQKRHPRIEVRGDKDTEEFVNAVAEVGRLWPQMLQVRTFGGATGSAAIGFKLIAGRPQFEVFDPRWCTPAFVDRDNLVLGAIEYRYTFKQEVRDEEGDLVERDFWYRRLIDDRRDVVFEPALADPKIPPQWVVQTAVEHSLGFCPVVWIQNLPALTDVDGEPDCAGVYDLSEAIDRLNAQAEKGILANSDPTVILSTDAQMGEVKKGSSNALKLPADGSASYMEMSGGGILQAREQSKLYKEMALEISQCVLEQPAKPLTATEVDRNYAAMLARADVFREQYGEMGIKKLINMVLVAAATLSRARQDGDKIVRYAINLPTRDDGTDHRLGPGPYQCSLQWPPYFEPSLDDATKAVNAAGLAKQAGLVDQVHATKFVAPYFQVEDAAQHAAEIASGERAGQDEIERMALAGAEPDQVPTQQDSLQDAALNGAQVQALADLITAVSAKQLPGVAAIELISAGFPVFTRDQVVRMVRSAEGLLEEQEETVQTGQPPPQSPEVDQ